MQAKGTEKKNVKIDVQHHTKRKLSVSALTRLL